ncbi:2-haloalkanoic acid dehalogenase [Colletotrichum spaethianum]|uniref:2-haloalkanoic acid dehalogenase n=1 Tax=Colletotrichum spaethianum TaxID=700344 RepID=A0AA37UJZ0_9PEZI|nr:2-haloalkanoic acid dehalogenase [Colletotrichum spaethianum]GKT50579.1 2-haloalkanoic acid dehalogenase [Colletotrichum spaethianum]
MTTPKNVVFDVVGTLVSYEHLFEAIDERLGEKLRARGILPRLLGWCWLEVAEREYTYLSMSGRYVVFYKVFTALFYRCLHYAGIENPRSFASDEDVTYLIDEWKKLQLREGAAECITKLRNAGFTVWCFTAGDIARVGGYFSRGGVDMPAENLLSCDTSGLAKPTPEAYTPILEKLSAGGGKPWFAAAHLWDASTAKTVGFNAAYCTAMEGEALPEIFGEMDVVAETLPAMADKMIATLEK